MNLKNLAIALIMGITSVGPLTAQEQPKPARPLSESDRKRIDELTKLIEQTQADLEYVQKNNKEQPDYNEQVANLTRKIEVYKGQLAFYKRETLPEPERTNPNSGGSTSSAGIDAIWRVTTRELTKEQFELYSKKKAEILAWYNDPKVDPNWAKTFRWKLGIDKDKPLTLENVPDDKFVKLLREHYTYYYTYRGPGYLPKGTKLETTGYYIRDGKRVEVPGLRVFKTPEGEYLFPHGKSMIHPDSIANAVAQGYMPELWPILFDNATPTNK